jgi:hypothetical protein
MVDQNGSKDVAFNLTFASIPTNAGPQTGNSLTPSPTTGRKILLARHCQPPMSLSAVSSAPIRTGHGTMVSFRIPSGQGGPLQRSGIAGRSIFAGSDPGVKAPPTGESLSLPCICSEPKNLQRGLERPTFQNPNNRRHSWSRRSQPAGKLLVAGHLVPGNKPSCEPYWASTRASNLS